MEDRDRFYLLKMLNATYRLSVLEDIPALQNHLAKVIQFYRHFLGHGLKRVRLAEEMEYLQLFAELYHQCGGPEMELHIPDTGELEIEVVANSIIVPVQDSLLNAGQSRIAVELSVRREPGGDASGYHLDLTVLDSLDRTILLQTTIF